MLGLLPCHWEHPKITLCVMGIMFGLLLCHEKHVRITFSSMKAVCLDSGGLGNLILLWSILHANSQKHLCIYKIFISCLLFFARPYVAKAKLSTSAAPERFSGGSTATLGCTSWILALL